MASESLPHAIAAELFSIEKLLAKTTRMERFKRAELRDCLAEAGLEGVRTQEYQYKLDEFGILVGSKPVKGEMP